MVKIILKTKKGDSIIQGGTPEERRAIAIAESALTGKKTKKRKSRKQENIFDLGL